MSDDFNEAHQKIYSAFPSLVAYENERRWLTYDLLSGRVDPTHPFYATLRDHGIAGAGLDVYEREPLERDSPLLAMDNVILTPHMAGLSDADQVAVRSRPARNVANALVGEWAPTRDLVNPAVENNPRPVPPPRSVSS